MNLSSFLSVGHIVLIPLDLIKSNPFSYRTDFNNYDLNILADSIKNNGLLQPILLNQSDNFFYIISGERRFRAFKLCGFKAIPSLIVNVDEKYSAFLSFIENYHRAELSYSEKNNAFSFFKINSLNCDELLNYDSLKYNFSLKNKPKLKMVSDMRIFFNTFNSTVETIKNAGIPVETENNENEDFIVYSVKIYKNRSLCSIN